MAGVVYDPEAEETSDLLLPTGAESVRIRRPVSSGALLIHSRLTSDPSLTDAYKADITLFDEEGEFVAEIVGARVQRVVKRRAGGVVEKQLLYDITWEPQDRENASGALAAETAFLLFADESNWASQLAEQMLGKDARVVRVGQGSSYEACVSGGTANAISYRIKPGESSDYEQLLAAVAEQGFTDVHVVDCWSMAGEASDSLRQDALAEQGCTHTLRLFQALAKAKPVKAKSTTIVTNGAYAVTDSEQVSPASTAL